MEGGTWILSAVTLGFTHLPMPHDLCFFGCFGSSFASLHQPSLWPSEVFGFPGPLGPSSLVLLAVLGPPPPHAQWAFGATHTLQPPTQPSFVHLLLPSHRLLLPVECFWYLLLSQGLPQLMSEFSPHQPAFWVLVGKVSGKVSAN